MRPSPVPLDTIATFSNNTPLWSPYKLDHSEELVEFRPYAHQIPFGIPPNALTPPSPTPFTVEWIREDDEYLISGPYPFEDERTKPTQASLRPAAQQALANHQQNVLQGQFRRLKTKSGTRFNRKAADNLHEKFKHTYLALKAPKRHITAAEGVGDTMASEFQSPTGELIDVRRPSWCSLTICPECEEQFWSPAPRWDRISEDPERPDIDTLADITWCPNCQCTDFTQEYLLPVMEFSQETFDKYTDRSHPTTGNDSDTTNSSLDSFV